MLHAWFSCCLILMDRPHSHMYAPHSGRTEQQMAASGASYQSCTLRHVLADSHQTYPTVCEEMLKGDTLIACTAWEASRKQPQICRGLALRHRTVPHSRASTPRQIGPSWAPANASVRRSGPADPQNKAPNAHALSTLPACHHDELRHD